MREPGEALAALERLERLASAGLDFVQIRQKSWDDAAVYDFAAAARQRLAPSCRVLVNRRFDIALAAGCDGVHLPAGALPPNEIRLQVPRTFLLFVSTHTPAEVAASAAAGADAVSFGPIYATPGEHGPPLGTAALSAVAALGIPVFALGGILSPAQAAACRAAGASGIASIRLFAGAEPAESLLTALRSRSGVNSES